MSYYYSPSQIEGMKRAGILHDYNNVPSAEDLDLISRNHKCSECGGKVKYTPVEKMRRTERDPYHFVCQECGCTEEDMPLKKG
jgi:tRNA G37 N-methylase Trm5